MAKEIPLSKKKTKYVKQFKPKYIVGEPLKPNIRIEQQTVKKLEALTKAMTKDVNKELKKLFKSEKNSPALYAQDASISSQARILLSMLFKKYAKIFDIEGKLIIDTMVNKVNNHSKASVKNSLKSLTGGISIEKETLSAETKEMIKASSSQAVSYIKSIQSQYLTQVEGAVYRSITSGEGLKDLVPALEKYEGMTRRRSRLIALDQVRKTNESINTARLLQNGITKGKWFHSEAGATPRKTHQAMNGKIFDIREGLYDSEVGRKVKPSELPNCKCFFSVVYEFNQE